MKRPYVICHMMTSVDGRIDCAMTEHLPGVQEYYDTLAELDAPSRVSGRVTAQLEMSLAGEFKAANSQPVGKEAFSKAVNAEGYEIVIDTMGTLLWEDDTNSRRPLLIVTSEKDRIDLKRACEILSEEFGVERMAVVGGGHINAGFLEAGLLDEVSILIGAGIDGRGGMAAVFDGLDMDRPVTPLKLTDVKKFPSDAVWLRYAVK